MNLLEEFCREIGLMVSIDIDELDIDYTEDLSEFNICDGEEGAYGTIKYYDIDGDLLAVLKVYGGDDEEIEFTQHGKNILKEKALNIFYNNLNRIRIYHETK